MRVPSLEAVTNPEIAFGACQEAVRLLLSDRADAPSLRRILPGMYSKRAVLAVGPEGGWTGAEVAAANKAGFQEVSLGKLILRTETAVAASLAALNYALGEE